MTNNVVRLDELKREFQATSKVEIAEIYTGFSRRFNDFIDISDIDLPTINNGRIGFIAELLNVSRPAVSDWLTKNKPPKKTTLFEVVGYFLKHIEDGNDILLARVVAWLRYGEEVSPCPFKGLYDASDNKELMPLAASLIANEAKSMGFGATSYDLEKYYHWLFRL
jgi:transcriptional regulator with XRE-family HTH domain